MPWTPVPPAYKLCPGFLPTACGERGPMEGVVTPESKPEVLHCPSCGRPHRESGRYCPGCGRDLEAVTSSIDGSADPLIGTVIADRYRFLDRIGQGGMGAVYRVEHVLMGKLMCMKLLRTSHATRPLAVRRFRQEIKAVSRLSHVHTVSVFDCGATEEGSLFIVMEYLGGEDLDRIINREGPMSAVRAARIGRQVCASLGEAHTCGIVHRDVKPGNIILMDVAWEMDFIKVLDFGIAKFSDSSGDSVTDTGLIVGTPYYMAPEQAKGDGDVGPAVDVYGLGIVLYELITGQLPFKGDTPVDYIKAHMRQTPPPPSKVRPDLAVPEEMERIVLQAIAKKPKQRFASIGEMGRALDNFLRGHEAEGYVPDPTADPRFTDSMDLAPERQSVATPNLRIPHETRDFDRLPEPLTPLRVQTSDGYMAEVASRKDWERFETRLRRGRRFRVLVPLLILLSCLGLLGRYLHARLTKVVRPETVVTAEVEPNNRPVDANLIALNREVRGRIGRSLGPGASDRDWFKIVVPPQGAVLSMTLKPPTGVDLELGLYRWQKQLGPRGKETRLIREVISVNNTRRGKTETLRAYRLPADTYYLLVREMPLRGEKPQEDVPGEYRLLARPTKVVAGAEVEPNGGPAFAGRLKPGGAGTGFHDKKGDRDYWRLMLPTQKGRRTVIFDAVRGVGVRMSLLKSDGVPQYVRIQWRRRRGRRRAVLSFPADGERYLVVETREGFNLKNPYRLKLEE